MHGQQNIKFKILFSILLSSKKGKIRVGEDVRVRGFYHHLSAEKSHNTEVQICYCNCVNNNQMHYCN